ncbi:MAG TPA: cellulase family glycosylhydrolase [Polyangiaceae bacterium]|nr:cellulase family glycosylhydrolase [Polyangiaceae bacterium]
MKFRHLAALCVLTLPLTPGCDGATFEDSPGSGGTDGGSDGPTPGENDLLIDDFEDGDVSAAIGGDWFSYTDQDASGASTVTDPAELIAGTGHDSAHALAIDFALDQGAYTYDPFVGVSLAIPGAVDVPKYEGITYWFQGAAHTVRFETTDITDYDYYVMSVPASTTWKQVTIPFSQLAQAGYGTPVEWSPELLGTLAWHVVAADGTSGALQLDDVWFLESAPIDRGPKNLVIRDAEPPVKDVLEDVAIPGALQLKAMAQLNRGYNLTNWLESGRFDGTFAFDESYVEKLAAAGFQGIRLPIDLDLYVDQTSGSGDAMTLTLNDDLWTVLDSFAEWTDTHGLSLTIDYHQYDHDWSFGDAAGVDRAVALWGAVATHFAANPRDDIYYELLNEPELSTGASGILPASSWTPVAQRMIDAIRVPDDTHTIIFGDVNWYGIEQLSARTPFADGNIVYAFHSYEPFIFTHQGADWAQMATTHDVPFPYTPERWSEYSSDFGLTTAQPNWIWDNFANYYKNGTVEAMYNRIVQAKRWGVENGVPVICNEFGAYERRSRLEDRVNYYRELIGAFAELEIPWQSWFMIMDDQGQVIPEYVEAFRLDP